MFNQIKHTLQYYYSYSIKPVITFWSLFFMFLLLSLLLSNFRDVTFHLTGITSLFSIIFMILFPIFTFKNVFPFVIKLGISRKAFVISTYIYSFTLSLIMTGLNYLYLYGFNLIADGFSIEGFNYIGLNMEGFVELMHGNVYLFDLLLHLTLFLFFTFLGSFFYRFGFVYGLILTFIFPLSMLIRSVGIKIVEALEYFFIFQETYTPLSFIITILISSALLWLVVNRASVIDQITKQN